MDAPLVTELAIKAIEDSPEKIDMHDFHCYQRLADCLPPATGTLILERLNRSAKLMAESMVGRWDEYGPKPLMLASSPASPHASLLADELQANLDYEIGRINDDGSWRPNWTWGGDYPEDWAQAEVEWAGAITVKTLKSLRDFGRLL